jgi:diguanylate cyclase (GGDEF)-like protein/hemerythrin-like metal-binding protein
LRSADSKRNVIRKIKNYIAAKVTVNNSVMDDMVLLNSRRVLYIAILSMITNIVAIILLGLENPTVGDSYEAKWHIGINASHFSMFFIMGVMGTFSFLLRKNRNIRFMATLQYIMIGILLVFGIMVVCIDQLVTANITTFLIVCTMIGAVFLLRPLYAIITYAISYVAFYIGLGFAQTDPAILLSNRVNGITAVTIGICLSIISWKTTLAHIQQRRHIAAQHRELEEKTEVLEYLAFCDPMTSLCNRRRGEELIKQEISSMRRYGHESCIILIDIDHFKYFNDTYGHPFGDGVIKEITFLLKKSVRESDMVSRWGGEEFLILLTHVSITEAIDIAEKLRKIIEERIIVVNAKVINTTISIGVAQIKPDRNDALEIAYKEADRALYKAKEEGRNRVAIATEDDKTAIASVHIEWRRDWESGNAEIDDQHKILLELGNALIHMGLSGVEQEKILIQLHLFINHMKKHFSYEEEVLKAANYPDTQKHAQIHEGLVEETLDFRNAYFKGEIKSTAFFSFIIDKVIIGHMLQDDVQAFPYLEKYGKQYNYPNCNIID